MAIVDTSVCSSTWQSWLHVSVWLNQANYNYNQMHETNEYHPYYYQMVLTFSLMFLAIKSFRVVCLADGFFSFFSCNIWLSLHIINLCIHYLHLSMWFMCVFINICIDRWWWWWMNLMAKIYYSFLIYWNWKLETGHESETKWNEWWKKNNIKIE